MLLELNGYSWNRLVISTEETENHPDFPALVIIGDGSPTAAAALVYVVQKLKNQEQNHVALVQAKSKLASLSGNSSPRQELVAMYLAAQLKTWVVENLPFEVKRSIIISDSTSALNQIRSRAVLFKPYEQTRIRNIQALTDPSEFYYCRSQNNSADLASKAGYVTIQLLNSDKWKRGSFLHKAESD